MEIFRRLNEERGITIAFVTHEPDVAAYTRRIVSLRDGEIVSDDAERTGLRARAARRPPAAVEHGGAADDAQRSGAPQ